MPIIKSTDIPVNPDFSFIQGRGSAILESAYKIMCENPIYWDIIFNFKEYSYLYSTDENINILMKLINNRCPDQIDKSGNKLSWIMLQLEIIINKGFTKYKDYYTRKIIFELK
jgi:hypothetical protein